MNPRLDQLIADMFANGSAFYPWAFALLTIISSCLGAYFGSYLKKKAEDTAANENYLHVLAQLKEQTRATEEIKASMSASLITMKDNLDRERSWNEFQRQQTTTLVEGIFRSAREIRIIADLLDWAEWNEAISVTDAQRLVISELASLQTNCKLLQYKRSIDDELRIKIIRCSGSVNGRWRGFISQHLERQDGIARSPDGKGEVETERYIERISALQDAVRSLEDAIGEVAQKAAPQVD